MTKSKAIAVGTTAAGVAACAVCCAAPVAAVAAGAVFAPVAAVAGVSALAITVAQRRHGEASSEGSADMSSVSAGSLVLRKVLALLLVVSAGLFIAGVAREHAQHHHETKPAASAATHVEGGDADSGAGERAKPGDVVGAHPESGSEGRVLGVDIETWPLVIGFAIVSVGLGVGMWLTRNRALVVTAGVVAAVAAIFDIAEIVHQVRESQTLLVVTAAAVTVLHVAAIALAILILRTEASPRSEDSARFVAVT